MLCPRCTHYSRDLPSDKPYYISYELRPLKRDTQRWCNMCALLWKSISIFLGDNVDSLYNYLAFSTAHGDAIEQSPHKRPLRADLRPREIQSGVRTIRLQFYVDEGSSLPWGRLGSAPVVADSALEERALGLVKEWMKQCSNEHAACKMNEEPKAPSRMINIPPNNSTVRLVDLEPSAVVNYAALSHCWGASSPLITTSQNLASHKQGISIDQLPLTFRDAVVFTRALGLELLWIDSLCIIQDSAKDWAYEASRMADVYRHATVTISTDAAKDCNTGCLSPPARLKRKVVSTPFNFTDGGRTYSGVLHMREKGLLLRELPIHGWHPTTMIENQPLAKKSRHLPMPACLATQFSAPFTKLSTRGWVFQERLLSRRSIHLGASELGWECRTCIKCECTANSVRSKRGSSLLKGVYDRDIKGDWTKLVQEYTRMDLTVPTDRLAAISGLAASLAIKRGNDTYLAGLWKSSLHDQLFWQVDEQALAQKPSKSRRFPQYYAPTWSWASVKAPVKFSPVLEESSSPGKIGFSVINIDFVHDSINYYGPPQRASLVIKGSVVQVRAKQLINGMQVLAPAQEMGGNSLQLQFTLDEAIDITDKTMLHVIFARSQSDSESKLKFGLQALVLEGSIVPGVAFRRIGYARTRSIEAVQGRKPREYSSDSDSSDSEDELTKVSMEELWSPYSTNSVIQLV